MPFDPKSAKKAGKRSKRGPAKNKTEFSIFKCVFKDFICGFL